jgi:hypothetical protein
LVEGSGEHWGRTSERFVQTRPECLAPPQEAGKQVAVLDEAMVESLVHSLDEAMGESLVHSLDEAMGESPVHSLDDVY